MTPQLSPTFFPVRQPRVNLSSHDTSYQLLRYKLTIVKFVPGRINLDQFDVAYLGRVGACRGLADNMQVC